MSKCTNCDNEHDDIIDGKWQHSEPIIVEVDSETGLCCRCWLDMDYQLFLYQRAGIEVLPDDYGTSDSYVDTMFEGSEL